MKKREVVVIGGGAAGFFSAISCAEANPNCSIRILEGGTKTLSKVAISGGGRCNVTHNCFDPAELIRSYPRGANELRSPFTRFQPKDTVEWFEEHGVQLYAEEDGRMFPSSDDSSTIIECFKGIATEKGIEIILGYKVKSVKFEEGRFTITSLDDVHISCDALVLATGSSKSGYDIAASFRHKITELAPSLFTFKASDCRLSGLEGISIQDVKLKLKIGDNQTFDQQGPLLITHWGVSGPAVLKLSAWAAREFASAGYQAMLKINWTGKFSVDQCYEFLLAHKSKSPQCILAKNPQFEISRRLWERLCEASGIPPAASCQLISHMLLRKLSEQLSNFELAIIGKGEFKEEFVTCGGVSLKEVNFKTMESKIQPGLFFAGEILDIDGITGGFNFQAAWTTGWIVGQSIGS